jgi:uncharacterized short protein YbdD (DUF466 family)
MQDTDRQPRSAARLGREKWRFEARRPIAGFPEYGYYYTWVREWPPEVPPMHYKVPTEMFWTER